MNEKLNLEQFKQLRKKITDEYNRLQSEYEMHKDDPDYDEEVELERAITLIMGLQQNLLDHDLSDIPFEEWEGYEILSNETHCADFSKSRANIDFNIVEYYGNGNFRGCNLKNLEAIGRSIAIEEFDEATIKAHPEIFLSDSFSEEFKEKFYGNILDIGDIEALPKEQLDELLKVNYKIHMDNKIYNEELINIMGLEKVLDLYRYSESHYEAINDVVNKWHYIARNSRIVKRHYTNLIEQLKTASVSELKDITFNILKDYFLTSNEWIKLDQYPKLFIEENPELFLLNTNAPEELVERFNKRELYIQDLISHPDLFKFPVDYFMNNETYINVFLARTFGLGSLQKAVSKYPKVFNHFARTGSLSYLSSCMTAEKDIDTTIFKAAKAYMIRYGRRESLENLRYGGSNVQIPEWINELNIKLVDRLENIEELMGYDEHTYIANEGQRHTIETLGIENIKRLERETGIFSHKVNSWDGEIQMFDTVSNFYRDIEYKLISLRDYGIDFKNGTLSYEEFEKNFVRLLDQMKANNTFDRYPNYDWITGPFRDNHPEIFIDLDVPEKIRKDYYANRITIKYLQEHPEAIKYIIGKGLSEKFGADMKVTLAALKGDHGTIPEVANFAQEYIKIYGEEKFIKLCIKYGDTINDLSITAINNELYDESKLDKLILDFLYNKIINSNINYREYENIEGLKESHPEIFINLDSIPSAIIQENKNIILSAFYCRRLSYELIKQYPEFIPILRTKNLNLPFRDRIIMTNYDSNFPYGTPAKMNSDLNLLKVFGNDAFLELCKTYGRYLENIGNSLDEELIILEDNKYHIKGDESNPLTLEDIEKRIQDIIRRKCKEGKFPYKGNDAPLFLKEENPELFLAEDAPEELVKYFYGYNYNYNMTFEILNENREWLPYLKGKDILASLRRANTPYKDELNEFVRIFGEEKAIKLGINRAETVTRMFEAHNVPLMKEWYDLTGGKFIPDCVVMQNFDTIEASKFLESGARWSNLMRIKEFSKEIESRDAMLKLAYSFGVFDNDTRGFKKIIDLLTDIPRTISPNYSHIIEEISYLDETLKNLPEVTIGIPTGLLDYIDLREKIVEEGFPLQKDQEMFKQIYRKNEDGSYSLTINPQNYPKSTQLIRRLLQAYPDMPLLTPAKVHQLFGGFQLKYDPAFREFLIDNLGKIICHPEYATYLRSVQKQFDEIRVLNSNRFLSLELAVSFVQSNKYENINVGNERVAEVSAIAGYSQQDFNTLQQIYNYGKQRTFSSIPRIEKTAEKRTDTYTYEILRLDDPLAMAIGTLTDCCQELNNCAEMCMEHSMVDQNGRVFVIKDSQGQTVAQSWVWRNKDVLCFDNIEIPDKAFTRTIRENASVTRSVFTDEIFEIYKQAAKDLIEADEKTYKELLDQGKITQEQYDGLRLGKITVGLGFNDIADSLQKNAELDTTPVSRPLPFTAPISLSRGLYTNDSTTQYVLEEREDRTKYEGETLTVHTDPYVIYDDETFTASKLLTLEKLEITTKGDVSYFDTSVNSETGKDLVSQLARNYGLNSETTRVIMNPNFAIIYDTNGDELRIGELLYNTTINNDTQQMDIESKVVMQIRLALEQIGEGKKINIFDLNDEQRQMYEKATGLKEEIDIEKGVSHAR